MPKSFNIIISLFQETIQYDCDCSLEGDVNLERKTVLLNSRRIKSIVVNGIKYVNSNYEEKKDAGDTGRNKDQTA
jgi:hypothetical protein